MLISKLLVRMTSQWRLICSQEEGGGSLRERDQNRRLNAAGLRSDLRPDRSADMERLLPINRAINDRPDLSLSRNWRHNTMSTNELYELQL